MQNLQVRHHSIFRCPFNMILLYISSVSSHLSAPFGDQHREQLLSIMQTWLTASVTGVPHDQFTHYYTFLPHMVRSRSKCMHIHKDNSINQMLYLKMGIAYAWLHTKLCFDKWDPRFGTLSFYCNSIHTVSDMWKCFLRCCSRLCAVWIAGKTH